MGHACVPVCLVCLCLWPVPVPVFVCASGLTHTAPRPTYHVDGDGVAVRAHQTRRQQNNTHHTRSPAAIRRRGKRRQSGKRYTGHHHHHHHHPQSSSHCDSGKCDHAASSLALPILRAPLVADAPHVYLQNLEWVHRYNTKVPFLTRLTPPPSVLRDFPLCTSPSLLRVWSPLPFIISSLRTLSTRYRSTFAAQSSPALPRPALPCHAPARPCPRDFPPMLPMYIGLDLTD